MPEIEDDAERLEPSLQRACACGGGCPSCQSNTETGLERQAAGPAHSKVAPASVHATLARPGRPLDPSSRQFFEPRFGRDFSEVRVHDNPAAAASARDVNARAYTVGPQIVFGSGQFRPDHAAGRALIGHELAHVVQQSSARRPAAGQAIPIASPSSSSERQAEAVGARIGGGGAVTRALQPRPAPLGLAKADPAAVDRIEALANTAGSAMQFIPAEITDTVVGPPPPGGWQGDRANRLNVIIGENMTPRVLARQLLPLWTTATPFTRQGASSPNALTMVDEETLAKGLMVYNRFYLGLPNMAQWASGLRFPLPIALSPDPNDASRVIGTLHPDVITSLAGTFDAAWTNLLDQAATAPVAPNAAAEDAAATAFLAQNPTIMDRGMGLMHHALTNVTTMFPLYLAINRQLNTNQRFELALEIMNHMVNLQVDMLASQTDGVLLLWEILGELANAPATPSADQQSAIDRANLMLNRPTFRLIDTPAARRTRPEKTITIDTIKLDGSTQNPATQIAIADAIYAQCNIRVKQGVDATATEAETIAWIGAEKDLRTSPRCGVVTGEERRMIQGARQTYGIGAARYRAHFVPTSANANALGWSCVGTSGIHSLQRGIIVVLNSGWGDTLAHELAHHLLRPGSHRSTG
ncbi:MAG: DUF4157 domain-containing protein, partial [Pseudomonadota bacterium]